MLNTIRQTGSALGSAIVLAVLQSQLAGGHGYVSALRAAIAVPVVALLIGAALALALRSGKSSESSEPGKPVPAEEGNAGESVGQLSDR